MAETPATSHRSDTAYGLCRCGCGRKTRIPKKTSRPSGEVRGVPMRFIRGHNARRSPVDYIVDPTTGCWEWQLHRGRGGYGMAWDPQAKRSLRAHRLYYERFVGPIPAGLDLDHTCDNHGCVNPAHMLPSTPLDNRRRSAFLTMEVARAVRRSPLSGKELAAFYGVGQSVISAIRRYRTWKEQPSPPRLLALGDDLEIARRLQRQRLTLVAQGEA